jgi:adenine-specific DNA-methyltransferase
MVSAKMKQTSGASGGGEDKKLKKNIEYLLIYSKNSYTFDKFNELFDEEPLIEYIQYMKDEGKSWKYTRVLINKGKRELFSEIQDGSGLPIKIYLHHNYVFSTIKELMASENLSEEECYKKYYDKIFRDTNAQTSIRTRIMEEMNGAAEFISADYVPRSGRNKGENVTLYFKGSNCDLFAWLKDIAVKKNDRLVKLEKVGTFWEGFPLNNLTKEGGVQLPNGKKPELLIEKVITLATNQGDLVLDSFAGSGTTSAVAHKLKRRWITIESGAQAITHVEKRLKRVVFNEDAGGVTNKTGWIGGGGFQFCRLSAEPLFTPQGEIREDVRFAQLAEFVWFAETGFGYTGSADSPLLGVHEGRAIYLLYNGILKDTTEAGGNVLTAPVFAILPPFNGPKTIYAAACRLSASLMQRQQIVFKQTPYALEV